MVYGRDITFWSDKDIIAYLYATSIHKGAVLLQKEVFAHFNVASKIHIKRRHYPRIAL